MKRVADKLRVEEEKKRKRAEEKEREAQQEREMKADLGSALFGNGFGENSFSAPPASSSWSNIAKVQEGEVSNIADSMSKTKLDIKQSQTQQQRTVHEPWPLESQEQYMPYFLYVESEHLFDNSATDMAVNQRFELVDASTSNDNDEWSSATADATDDNTIDKVFQKFADIVAQNSEQVVRYERSGTPMMYSKSDAVASQITRSGVYDSNLIPRCPLCGGNRVFEFQLMPYTIEILEQASGIDMVNGMEWGTMIVATCEKDCLPTIDDRGVGYAEEWVGVQWEEIRR